MKQKHREDSLAAARRGGTEEGTEWEAEVSRHNLITSVIYRTDKQGPTVQPREL